MMLSWVSIFRLGLVQLCLGAIVVLTTSTLNRLAVVEFSLPAVLPGLLVRRARLHRPDRESLAARGRVPDR